MPGMQKNYLYSSHLAKEQLFLLYRKKRDSFFFHYCLCANARVGKDFVGFSWDFCFYVGESHRNTCLRPFHIYKG